MSPNVRTADLEEARQAQEDAQAHLQRLLDGQARMEEVTRATAALTEARRRVQRLEKS